MCVSVCVVQILEYSLVQKEYTEWSRTLQKHGLHSLWLERDTPVTHVAFNPKNPAHIILHDMFMFCIIDQSLVCSQSFKLSVMSMQSLENENVCVFSFLAVSERILKNTETMFFVSLLPHAAPP